MYYCVIKCTSNYTKAKILTLIKFILELVIINKNIYKLCNKIINQF